MKQVVQNLGNGATRVEHAPSPRAGHGALLIRTRCSLISSGTERMLVDFGKASLIDKARQQPERVQMTINKAKTDGVLATIDAVRSKLSQPIPLGYCNVGVIAEVGSSVEGYKVGSRVVSNSAHADLVTAPKNLCALIPDSVSDQAAVFTVLASIGLQGIRLAQPTLGEAFVVTGVGVIGLLTVQLLRAHGCRVLAIDFDRDKLQLAAAFGAQICDLGRGEDPVAAGMGFSRGRGVDGVIITAATASNDPVAQAAQMSRKRGRIILVGVTGLELNRSDFYEKELIFQVSCSYGPGRYDPSYEQQGVDYPIGLVRWSEQRNFEAVLDMLADGRLDVSSLISHRVPFDEAPTAYEILTTNKAALGIVLEYPDQDSDQLLRRTVALNSDVVIDPQKPVIGFVGAGNYAGRVLIPAFRKAGAQLKTITTSGGLSGALQGRRSGFAEASTDVEAMLADRQINAIAIVTRHNSHAALTARALAAGKHVFVEKPLALNIADLDEVESAWTAAKARGQARHLMIGFNRRFAPQVVKMKSLLDSVKEPKAFIMTVNAGAIPPQHWTQDPDIGGGRIVGEACHFIDLLRHLAGANITTVEARRMGDGVDPKAVTDKAVITLGFADGSLGTIHYLANGSAAFPKERLEVFAAGRILQLNNYRKLRGFGWPGFKRMNLWRLDKGQEACAAAFLKAVEQGGRSPIPPEEIFEVSRRTIQAAEILGGQ